MDFYPNDYVAQQVPLVVIQGLGQDLIDPQPIPYPYAHTSVPPTSITRALPDVPETLASPLKSAFKEYDISDDIWCERFQKSVFGVNSLAYRFRFVDKFMLPSKPKSEPKKTVYSPDKSLLSPFNPQLKIYPHGLLDTSSISKHRDHIPSVYISVHVLEEEVADEADLDVLSRKDLSLAKEITTLRNQVQSQGLRFLQVVVAAHTDQNVVHRVNNIRNITGLAPRTGLLLFSGLSVQDYSNFARDVLHLIRPWCFDHYIALERRLRKKRVNPPSAQLSKSVLFLEPTVYSLDQWDARYATKLALVNLFHQNNEMSIKHLESAYEALLTVALEVMISQNSDNRNALLLWNQTRLLLDIVAINIVKTCLYLEVPNKAYKRFLNHMGSVTSILKREHIDSYAIDTWASIQKEWLGDLCCAADIPLDRYLFKDSEFEGLALPHPGLIYLQSANHLYEAKSRSQIKRSEESETISELRKDPETLYFGSLPPLEIAKYAFNEKVLVTLNKALIPLMRSKDELFERARYYVKFQLAEAHYALNHPEKAAEFYQECADFYRKEGWLRLLVILLVRQVQCYQLSNKWSHLISLICELASFDEIYISEQEKKILLDILLKNVETVPEIHLNDSSMFSGVFLFAEPVISVGMDLHMQFALQSHVNPKVIPGLEVSGIKIEFDGPMDDIIINHSPGKLSNNLFEIESPSEENLEIPHGTLKVFQLTRAVSKVGVVSVSSILIRLTHPKFSIVCQLLTDPVSVDDGFLDSKSSFRTRPSVTRGRFFWVDSFASDRIKKHVIATQNPYATTIIPRRPETIISVENPTAALLNEIYEVRLRIDNRDSENVGVVFRALIRMYDTQPAKPRPNKDVLSEVSSPRKSLDVRDASNSASPASVSGSNAGVTITNAQWDGYDKVEKSSEEEVIGLNPLDLKLPDIAPESEEFHSLFIKVPPVVGKHFVVKVECSFFTGENIAQQQAEEEDNGLLSTRDTFSIRAPIVAPVKFLFSVMPKAVAEEDNTIPPNSRTWCMRLSVQSVGNTPLELVDAEMQCISGSENYTCESIESPVIEAPMLLDAKHPSHSVLHVWITSKKSAEYSAPVPLSAVLHIKWRRAGSRFVNSFSSQPWKLKLPLSEPRVLLEVQKLEKGATLRYYIENPTTRIFNFSTFITGNDFFDVEGDLKEIPHLQVQPFTRLVLEFEATARKVTSGLIKIPPLRVYDLVYKVTLPVMLAVLDGIAVKGEIFISLV